MDIKKFSDYFDAPMVKIPGKMFPVEIEFLPQTFTFGKNKKQAAVPLASRAKNTVQYVEVRPKLIHDQII